MNQTKEASSGRLWLVVAILILTILLLVGYKLKGFSTPEITEIASPDSSCNLRETECWASIPSGGKIGFSISPNNIPILMPLELTVKTQGIDISVVDVDFVGVDMDMGYNRTSLKSTQANHFKGTAMIPICMSDKMEWEARVLVQTATGLIMSPFRFYTFK